MTDDKLHIDEHERVRVEIYGEPESEWNGLDQADVYWAVFDRDDSKVLSFSDADPELTVDTNGGGNDPGVITVDLAETDTAQLPEGTLYQRVFISDTNGNRSGARTDPYRIEAVDEEADQIFP